MSNDPKTLAEATKGDREAVFWLDQLRQAEKVERDWRQKADKVLRRYKDEERRHGTKLNIFYSNVETLKPRVYSQTPSPDVRRRRIHEDDHARSTGRKVAQLLERSLSYAVDDWDFDEPMKAVRDDMLITGRGVARIDYQAEFVTRRDIEKIEPDPTAPGGLLSPEPLFVLDGEQVFPEIDQEGPFVEQKIDERVDVRHVFWADFRMSPARCWHDTWWVAFRHPMTREELEEEFPGVEVKGVPLSITPGKDIAHNDDVRQPADPEHAFGRAVVWELWNKKNKTRVWVAEGYDKVLRKDPDPLNLEQFFPMPAPIYAVKTTDTMIPKPEFTAYQDQADQLDEYEDRISNLTKAMKAVICCDGDFHEIIDIRDAKDGTVIPITAPGKVADDLKKSLFEWPIEKYVQVIAGLSARAEVVKKQIYELTGLSDLARGDTKASETFGAQRLKAGFGDARMIPRAQPMAEFIRDMLRLQAEVMAEMFDKETLERIGGMPVD